MVSETYTREQLERILHLQPRQLERWQRRGLFPDQPAYGWRDLLRARALRQYDEARISSRAVERGLEAAKARAPELGDPLAEAAIEFRNGRAELRFQGVRMDALSGQLGFDFPAPGGDPREIKPAAAGPDRNQAEAEQWFAFALSLEGEPELRPQAAAAYEHCIRLDPGFTSAHINLGTLRYQEKNFAEAERCYRAAAALDPDYALARFNLGNVLDETGRLGEAVEAYKAAVRLAPSYADAHYNLALAYQRLGEPRRAVPHWQQYLGLDRKSAWADHARRQLKQTLERDGLKLIAQRTPVAS